MASVFIGGKEVQRAAAQALIEAQTHLARAAASLRTLRKALDQSNPVITARVNRMVQFLDSEITQLDHHFDASCREAFAEEPPSA